MSSGSEGVGTTLCPNDRPTDRPTEVPTHYLSLRVTVPHTQWDTIKDKVLKGVPEYVAYPHDGKAHDNPHFHIVIPTTDASCPDRYRKRVKDAFKDRRGDNGLVSCKFQSNGILNALTYMAKESTRPYIAGDVQSWIDNAPAWVQNPNIGAYLRHRAPRELNPDHYRELTFRNLEKATLRYRQSHGIKSDQLEDTLTAMHADNYRMNVAMVRSGIPAAFYDEFTAKCKGTTTWSSSRFAMMRSLENWRVSYRS